MRLNKLVLPERIYSYLIKIERLNEDDEIVILETGRSGEPLKSLQKWLWVDRFVNLHEGDLVFITTTPSMLWKLKVARTRDMIYRSEQTLKAIFDELNSSGHASKNDLQLMMNLVKTTLRHSCSSEYECCLRMQELARELGGFPSEKHLLPQKGDVL